MEKFGHRDSWQFLWKFGKNSRRRWEMTSNFFLAKLVGGAYHQDWEDPGKPFLFGKFENCFFFFFFNFIYLFIYFGLCWVFVSVRGLPPVVASGGHSSSRCAGPSLSWPLLLQSTGSRRAGSVVVAHGPSCSTACGILPDQGSNPCPLHWQADSQPLRHQGSPENCFLIMLNLRCLWGIQITMSFLAVGSMNLEIREVASTGNIRSGSSSYWCH